MKHNQIIDDIKIQYDNLLNNFVNKPIKYNNKFYITQLDEFDSNRIVYSTYGMCYYIKNCGWINDKGIPQHVSLSFTYSENKLTIKFCS